MRGGIRYPAANRIRRQIPVALLGLIVVGFFIATLANRDSSSLVFAANTPEPSALWAWGGNGSGQLGDGTTANKTTPTQEYTRSTDWSAIAAEANHTVALRSDGTLGP